MRYYLLVKVDAQHWKELKRGTRDECEGHGQMTLGDDDEWMVVKEQRYSYSSESINKSFISDDECDATESDIH